MPDDEVLATIAAFFPVRHVVQGTLGGFGLPGAGSLGWHLLVLAVWTAGSAAIAVRGFRWGPSR